MSAISNGVATATVLATESLSDAIVIKPSYDGALRPAGVAMPSAWTAANLTFEVSADGGATYNPLYDGQGNEYVVTAAAARYILLDPAVFRSISCFKIRSGTSGLPVVQVATRVITVYMQ